MRNFKILFVGFWLAFPSLAAADAGALPGDSAWYFHLDLDRMRKEPASQSLYAWMQGEVFDDLKEDSGVDISKELDQLTAYSTVDQGPVFLFEGDLSQVTEDRIMAMIAGAGDLRPVESSGKQYYRLTDGEESNDEGGIGVEDADANDIEFQIESLEKESWISMAFKNKVFVTGSEDQMKALLKSGGKIGAGRNTSKALLVLSADKTLLQAGLDSDALAGEDDGDSGWESNILRNTEQVAFLVAAKAEKLAIEAKLVTTDPEMANSLAGVFRGLISLASLSGDMDDAALGVIKSTKVEAEGTSLTLSLDLDPEMLVATLGE
jgi:hypothetical protein